MGATEHTHRVGDDRQSPRLVSVVIPVKNGAHVLPNQLAALERQTYQGDWEVLVVDNGSTDGTVAVAESWAGRLPLRIVDASDQRGIAHARNRGLEESKGELVTYCDCDDEASPQWLEALVETAQEFDQVGGRLETALLNGEIERSWRGSSLDAEGLPNGGLLPYATGANFAVWKDVAVALGGWSLDYQYGGDDVEFSYRLQLAGHRLGFAKDAVMHYRLRPDLRSMLRQVFRYSVASVQLYRDFRQDGLGRRKAKVVLYHWGWLPLHLHWLFRGSAQRGLWLKILARLTGRLVGSARYRVRYL